MNTATSLAASLSSAPQCRGIDVAAFVDQLRRELAGVDATVAVHRAMAVQDQPEKPIIGFIVKLHGDEGMERTTFSRLHWVALCSTVTSAVATVLGGPWLAAALTVASSVYAVCKLPLSIQGLQAQVLYEVCLSCNDLQAHEVLHDTLYVNLEDSRQREGVTFPSLNPDTFDAAVDALLNAGILARGRQARSVRLGELVVPGSSGWL
ncbi:hypothetical protein [Hydrogenophaga sp.]|uniref:hypothetical protein n=1 Tax=Hydrogenophaga sp. TaxID=1904254 RepID=UPI00273196A7|nr:hypothetical protein [Hydrogenophaga sp.]MDP2017913.1 hypothetical protein [Hydrogenophaga sp.]